jgi:hypothetical protein
MNPSMENTITSPSTRTKMIKKKNKLIMLENPFAG